MKNKALLFAMLLFGTQFVVGQDALTSVKINICNIMLSPNAKTISYDVCLQSTNKDTLVAVPGFLCKMNIPQSDIGSNEKKMTVTNLTEELGCVGEAITQSGSDWVIKFLNGKLVMSYETALKLSSEYPGTRIGTINITNADGKSFADPLSININHPGVTIREKMTTSVFIPNSTYLAPRSTAPQPVDNFTGLGSYSLSSSASGNFSVSPNPASDVIKVKTGGEGEQTLRVYDIKGVVVLNKTINKSASINISSLPAGSYMVEVNGISKKLVKK